MNSVMYKMDCKNVKETSIGWTPLLLLICVSTTIGTTIPVGYFLGVLNTPAKHIQAWCNETLVHEYDTQLSDAQLGVLWACVVSIFQVGGICGSFAGAWCSDKYGRKGCLIISCLLLLIAGLLFIFCRAAKSLEMLIVGRFVGGIAAALIITAQPMYMLELAPSALKGRVGVCTGIGITGGIFLAQVITLPAAMGTEPLWHYALSSYMLLVLFFLVPAYCCPESPRWLYMLKQDADGANLALVRLRGEVACVQQEVLDMAAEYTAAQAVATRTTFWGVLTDSELFLPLLLVCSFQASQQLSGINAIFFYSVSIFTDAGFTDNVATWMNLGIGFFNVLVATFGPLLILRYPRRTMMMTSCGGCGLALCGSALGLRYINLTTWLPSLCICFVLLFILFFQFGLAPIPYFIGSELLEVAPRPVAMSMGSLFSWIGNFLIGMCFPLVQSVWNSFAFLPCVGVCLYCLLLTWRYLPETSGRNPSDLKPLMRDGLKSKIK